MKQLQIEFMINAILQDPTDKLIKRKIEHENSNPLWIEPLDILTYQAILKELAHREYTTLLSKIVA